MKIVTLKKEEFVSFASTHPLANYYQSPEYARVMKNFGFNHVYIGFVHNGKLVGASLILHRPVFLNFRYGYAPRGLLLNYNDSHLLELALKKLKSYLRMNGYLVIKIDPLIIKSKRNANTEIIYTNEHFDEIMMNMKKCGFTHCGFNNYMESVKPRWHAEINLSEKSSPDIFEGIKKQVKNKLRKAVKLGVEVFVDKANDVETMYEFIKDKGNYSLKYYKELSKQFGSNMEIYFAKINTENYVYNSQVLYEKEQEINDYLNDMIQNEGSKGKDMHTILNRKMESDKVLASYKNHLIAATDLLKDHPEDIVIGGAIVIKQGSKAFLLIDGYKSKYKSLCSGFILKWRIIEKLKLEGFETLDLNAISGDFTEKNKYKGLNEVKLGFNPTIIEYIGEFNLISNKVLYSLYKNTRDKYNIKNQKK